MIINEIKDVASLKTALEDALYKGGLPTDEYMEQHVLLTGSNNNRGI